MRSLIGLVAACALLAQDQKLTPEARRLNLESFEKVWTTVRDKHWEKAPGGLDWQAIHDEFRPRAEAASTMEDSRNVMREMLGRLKQTHFGIVPASVYEDVGRQVGEATPGIELRLLDGHAIVTRVEPESSAAQVGVKPGWEVVSVAGKDMRADIAKLAAAEVSELTKTRSLEARLSGRAESELNVGFVDGEGKTLEKKLKLAEPRGQLTRFGNLPAMAVWTETRKIANAGYYRFNVFLDPERVINGFGDLVGSCKSCDGLIIDLRGNPGGIGGMAMGMSGFLIDKPNQRLGTMIQRDVRLNFTVNPRVDVFEGPVAVLVDGNSASTSEIFAGGLRDLGRAQVFGSHSAAAALPSIFERLPNGDGFQYAVANYVSEGGKPLEGLGVPLDHEVHLTREGLLAGRDAVIDAAVDWIQQQKKR